MVDQQISHEEVLDGLDEQRSVYGVIAHYVNKAQKNGLYVRGFVDGEETYDLFLKEFNAVCNTKFIIRTSWRKFASTLPRRSRYGKEERIYWEYNSGNLQVPFSGEPFVVRSCLTMHCQYGSHYYKTTAERVKKQLMDHQHDPSIPLPIDKKRRRKPSKKRNCPAIMHVREVVMFPDYALDLKGLVDTKYHLRQEKSQLLLKLKDALTLHKTQGAPLNSVRRFYINIPLPEAHIGHIDPCRGIGPTIHPSVTEKIEELLSMRIYDARHVRIIIHDFVKNTLLKQDNGQVYQYNVVLYPTENEIADYIYMSSITVKPPLLEHESFSNESDIKGQMEGSINELVGLIQNCQSPEALAEATDSMKKIIKTVKRQLPSSSSPKRKRKKLPARALSESSSSMPESTDTNDNDILTEIVIFQGKDNDELSLDLNHFSCSGFNHSDALSAVSSGLLEDDCLLDKRSSDISRISSHTNQLEMHHPSSSDQLNIIHLTGNR